MSAYTDELEAKPYDIDPDDEQYESRLRQFYLIYAQDQSGQTLSDQFKDLPAVSTGRKYVLSWSPYLKLMRFDDVNERHFYKNEAARNN